MITNSTLLSNTAEMLKLQTMKQSRERSGKQAANALVARQPGTLLIRSLTTVTKWDVGDGTPGAFLHYWRGT